MSFYYDKMKPNFNENKNKRDINNLTSNENNNKN